ncbi:MAG: hypothetical protein CW345_02135 [Firmicutes bacterium]|nr:hypothetical protein [Bacillota bacterium]MBO2520594.1 hypothetical protein [Bacillota bacterium]
MYLKAILLLGQESPPVTVTKVAEFMGVSPASASEMIKRMEQNRLVDTTGSDGITLTEQGAADARRLVRRMRLAERLLSDILHLPLPLIYDEACKLEHALSDIVEERLVEVLGDPETCPHGFPIPSLEGRVSCPLLESMSVLEPGDEARVISLPERDSELLQYLTEQGILPGVEVRVDEIAPFNGPMFITIGGQRKAISREALAEVRVQRLAPAANEVQQA